MGKCFLKKPKIILVPYPAQGHVTPMVKLGSAFLSHEFEPIIVTPEFIHHKITATMAAMDDGMRFLSIPDGMDPEGPRDFFSIEKAMENVMPKHLESLIRKVEDEGGEGGRVVCMVIDLLASWAIEVANRCEIPAAGFWTAMQATYRLITAIPDMLHSHIISKTGCPQHQGKICSLPSQPLLSTEDLPWLIGTRAARNGRFKFWTKTLERSATLPWILVNSFPQKIIIDDDDEQSTIDDHVNINKPIIFPVVPLGKQAMVKNPSFWEEDVSCLDWLDKQRPNSVLYISFGSWVSPIGDSKVKTLALTLEALRLPFIWVLAHGWRHGLPNGFLERVSKQGQGKLVAWAPQLQVLQHKAVGLYLTHCGWNSTMEAIQCQKLLLCYPVAGDQFVNCKYIVKVWRIGVKVGGFGQKDFEEALRKVMEDGEMKERLEKLYERTMGDEASSRVAANLKAFLLDSITKQFTKSLKNVKHYNL